MAATMVILTTSVVSRNGAAERNFGSGTPALLHEKGVRPFFTYNGTSMMRTFFSRTRAILTGFATTFRYIFKPSVTVNYPEQKIPMFPKYRGKQEIMRDEPGLEKAVAC